MNKFTIEQLEALKEGADSAPWRPEYDEGEEHWVIAFDHPKFGGRWDKGIAHGEGAAKLFAAAPDLVDALIAEKQAHAKLRAEVEKLRDRKRSLSKTQYQTARDLKNGIFDETFGTMPETHTVEAWEMGARSNQRTATALTRILEGDNG